MSLKLENQNVWITGASSGVGEGMARVFYREGANIIISARREDELLRVRESCGDGPGAVQVVPFDLVDREQREAAVAHVLKDNPRLDVVVNNAGIAGPTGGIDAISDAEWQATININLTAQYRFAHHAVPMLKESSHGHLLHIASVAGRLGYAWRTPYAATKWAIVGLMKSLASELGESDIRVNALLPGIVEGPRMDGVIRARAEQVGVPEAEMRQEYLNKISLKRMVTAEDVAAMALFLCSPAARNVTGQAISVDGNVEYL